MNEEPPNDSIHLVSLEERVFGGRIPKAKPATKRAKGGGIDGRKGRGGRNEEDYKNPSTPLMMGAVENILGRSKR